MQNLTASQLKALSEFLNTIAAAWFTAGVISPFFLKPEDFSRALILGFAAVALAATFLSFSLSIVRRVKL